MYKHEFVNSSHSSSSFNKPWSPKPVTSQSMNKKDFFKALNGTYERVYKLDGISKYSLTENGAWVYATTGNAILDMNFSITQYRGKDKENQIKQDFRKAFNENPLLAIKWLFYCRDIREGVGERNLFRVCMNDLADNGQDELVNELISLIAEYGRWDDVTALIHSRCRNKVLEVVKKQLSDDVIGMAQMRPISLLAKWIGTEQSSNPQKKLEASIIMKYMKKTPREYRKMISSLRNYLDVVECKMSSDNWQSINYEAVPSKANLLYKDAFLKHDTERRLAYIEGLQRGEAKINANVSFPHEIVQKYLGNISYFSHYYDFSNEIKYDQVLESMWNSLPNLVDGNNSTLVVSDGSGSMTCTIPGTNTMCWTVSQAIAMYFSERCTGAFKNKFITFSARPKLVDLSKYNSLKEKILEMVMHDDCSNTNIEATFDLILDTAVRHRMDQNELPKNVLIISDMQFDSAAYDSYRRNPVLFKTISSKFEKAGYKMPKLIFWNVNCRNTGKTIPVTQNENGVILISGFSVNLCKMVMNNKTDPFDCLVDTLNSSRYDAVEEACRKIWRLN